MGEMRGRAGVVLILGALAVLTGALAARWQRPAPAPMSAVGVEAHVEETPETVYSFSASSAGSASAACERLQKAKDARSNKGSTPRCCPPDGLDRNEIGFKK